MGIKSFVRLIFYTTLTSIFFVVSINFIVDPLYNWGKIKTFDFKRNDFDERIQKTNYLANINNDYDSILLGNSRSTYLRVDNFDLGYKIFNYSVNAMSVYEYEQVIENFIDITGKEPKMILIGIDPFDFLGQDSKVLEGILEKSSDISLKVKNLLSLDVLNFSIQTLVKTIKISFNIKDRKQRYYNNKLLKGNLKENNISNEKYLKEVNYSFNIDYRLLSEYKRLKEKYSNSEFLVYCLPFHERLISNWQLKENFEKKNQKFIFNLLKIFNQIYYFNYITKYNSSYNNFYDTLHFYPFLGKKIIENINSLSKSKNNNYGFLLTTKNYKEILEKVIF